MRCIDVNVLVNAHRVDAPHHDDHRRWLDHARQDHEPLGVTDLVLSGFLRVVTHPRVFREPTPLAVAIDFVEALRSSPAVTSIAPGDRHWAIFIDLCRTGDARGNLIPDAFLAALAIENSATLVTADRGFRRFDGLRLENPADDAGI
ncbi:MAG TPA: type II toxin-antitoxin system VapC family toxin [Acidimicrobiia bacterium]|nr:type II toxin-antitoxin system VapC family toxin [Acidimicrobiia bacterium]